MQNENKKQISTALIISIVLNIFLVAMLIFLGITTQALDFIIKPNSISSNGGLPGEFKILNETWGIINKEYIDKTKIDPEKLSQGAVKGMVDALDDKYSGYVDPDMTKLETNQYKGKFQGIGAVVGLDEDDQLIIITPIDNSPAKEAGLRPKDRILKINGVDTTDMSTTEAALKIQGPAGTDVILQILREGQEVPFDIKLIRREINLQTVQYDIKENIAYVRLTVFQQNTVSELSKALKEANTKKIQGIILDLRNNPGGLLDTAVIVSSQFLKDGIVAQIVDNTGIAKSLPVIAGGIATKLPMVVLINNGSASSSEIVAGALQDYNRAKLIGTTTYGKGSAQTILRLSDGSTIHLTTGRWLTPNGHQIDKIGLKPDIPSDLENDQLVNFAIDYLKSNLY